MEFSEHEGSQTKIAERYELVGKPIHELNGKGIVFKAHDEKLGRDIALKKLDSDAEAKLLGSKRHRNIVEVYDYFEEGEDKWMVMEFLEKENNLEHRNRYGPPFSPEELTDIAQQTSDGLAFLHDEEKSSGMTKQSVIHRDIKPFNMFYIDGTLKIIDIASQDKRVGTNGYAPNETYKGLPQDERSDSFSLAATMYDLMRKSRVYDYKSDFDVRENVFTKIRQEELLRVTASMKINSREELIRVFHKGLSTNPDERYQTPKEFANAFRKAMIGE